MHHTAGRRLTRPTSQQTVEQIARFHATSDYLKVGGAPGIAYHYVIGPEGRVFKCWPARTITWCVKGMNTGSLCVALIGNFEVEEPTSKQWDAAVHLCRNLRVGYGLLSIQGHREVLPGHTVCPGRMVSMLDFRRAVEGHPKGKEGTDT